MSEMVRPDTDIPRTQRALERLSFGERRALAEECSRLERELSAARQELAEARASITSAAIQGQCLMEERDQWREVAVNLFSHLDIIRRGEEPRYDLHGVDFENSTDEALEQFRKLKEATK